MLLSALTLRYGQGSFEALDIVLWWFQCEFLLLFLFVCTNAVRLVWHSRHSSLDILICWTKFLFLCCEEFSAFRSYISIYINCIQGPLMSEIRLPSTSFSQVNFKFGWSLMTYASFCSRIQSWYRGQYQDLCQDLCSMVVGLYLLSQSLAICGAGARPKVCDYIFWIDFGYTWPVISFCTLNLKLRGEGGVPGQKNFFLCFHICCSPGYPRSKMGSFASQLQTVAEIWRDEDGTFSRVFGLLYRKIGNFHVSK